MANLIKRGNVYWCDLYVDGRRLRKSLRTSDKRVATEKLRDLELKALRRQDGIQDNRERLADILNDWIVAKSSGWRPTTERRYRVHVANLLRCLPSGIYCDQLYERTLAEFRRLRLAEDINGKPPSLQTIAKDEIALNVALNWAASSKLIADNPIKDIKPPEHHAKERRALTRDEVRLLIDASSEPYRTAFEFLALTGMRKGEFCQLKFSDIDTERNEIVIRGEVAKGKRQRRIPIGNRVGEIIQAQREGVASRTHKAKGGRLAASKSSKAFSIEHVFVSGVGSPMGHNLTREFTAACKRAGIVIDSAAGVVVLHSLRATCATELLKAGMAPHTVQGWLGHASLQTTMRIYAKLHDADMRDAADAISF